MERNRFVVLAFVAFGCVLASFVTLGFGRLLVGYRTGLVLAAPFGLLAFVLVVVLFATSVWTVLTGDADAPADDSKGNAESAAGGGEDRENTTADEPAISDSDSY